MSRLAVYEKTKHSILQLISEVELPPCSQFEQAVVSGSVSTFEPTANNMKLLVDYANEVSLCVL